MLLLVCSKKLFKQITFIPPHKDKCKKSKTPLVSFFLGDKKRIALKRIKTQTHEYIHEFGFLFVLALGSSTRAKQ